MTGRLLDPATGARINGMSELLITNGRVVTWVNGEEILENGALLVSDGRIAAIGESTTLAQENPDVTLLDAGGQLVMPGNICAHTHF